MTASEGREQELPTLSRLPYLCKQPCVYDTRYDDWARTLATLGAEVTMTDHFRYEVYIARQADRLPEEKNLDALGVVLKWYC